MYAVGNYLTGEVGVFGSLSFVGIRKTVAANITITADARTQANSRSAISQQLTAPEATTSAAVKVIERCSGLNRGSIDCNQAPVTAPTITNIGRKNRNTNRRARPAHGLNSVSGTSIAEYTNMTMALEIGAIIPIETAPQITALVRVITDNRLPKTKCRTSLADAGSCGS